MLSTIPASEPQIHQVRGAMRTIHRKRGPRAMAPMMAEMQQSLELVAHPGAKGLRGQAVLLLAVEALIPRQRETQDGRDDQVLQPVKDVPQPAEARDALGQVAHAHGPARLEQQEADERS